MAADRATTIDEHRKALSALGDIERRWAMNDAAIILAVRAGSDTCLDASRIAISNGQGDAALALRYLAALVDQSHRNTAVPS